MDDVASRLRATIRREGPIPFDRFMREALYGPGGFYDRPPVGAGGHFVTAPHVHPVFSRLVGAAVEGLWEELGRPLPIRVVELGAGDGTMAREILGGFARGGIELDYLAVEASAGARAALTERGIAAVAGLERLEPLEPGVIVANELLDNLPFRRLRRRDDRLVEVAIGLEGDRLTEIEIAWSGPPPDPAPLEGWEVVVPVAAFELVDQLAPVLSAGYVLLIDYEATAGGDVRGYRHHRLVSDLLDDPGSADITAGVDLDAIGARARRRGLVAFEPVTQRGALDALGLQEWSRRERERQAELLSVDRGRAAVRVWGDRARAQLLTDPAGLGALRWLLLATPHLPEPAWMRRARELDRR